MNYLEQTYLKQINQLQEELNSLKMNEKFIIEQSTNPEPNQDQINALNQLEINSEEADAAKESAMADFLDSLGTSVFSGAAVQSLMSQDPIDPKNIKTFKDTLKFNVQSFFKNVLPIYDVGDKLAATLVNAAGRNPLEFAKAVSYTRYNPFAVYSDYETRQQQQIQSRSGNEPE